MIRKALPTDVPAMVALTRFYFPRLKNEAVAFDEQTFTAFATAFVAGSPTTLALVSEQDGQLAAFIFCAISKHFLTGETVGSKLLWEARPDMAGHGRLVLRAAEEWWRQQGVRRVLVSCFDARTEQLLKLNNYHETEKHFEKVIS